MIVNEVSILRRVKHPNVIRLVQEFDTTTDIYLVMELVNVSVAVHFYQKLCFD